MSLKIRYFLLLSLSFSTARVMAQQSPDLPSYIQESIHQVEQHPELVTQIENNLSLFVREKKDFDLLKTSLLIAIQKSPDNKGFSDMLAWQFIQQKYFASAYIQYVALDRRGNEDGERLMELGSICLSNDAFDDAIKAFSYVVTKGPSSRYYQEARMQVLDAGSQKIEKASYTPQDLASQEKNFSEFLRDFGKNAGTAKTMYGNARFLAEYLNKSAEAIELLTETIQIQGINPFLQAECKLELGNVYVATGEIWDAALLYGQVDKAFKEDPLGQEAKLRSAKIYYYTGEFVLAKSQLDVLKTATSELVSNDALELSLLIQENNVGDSSSKALKMYARADLLIVQNKLDPAQKTLDSIQKLYPAHALNDDILMAGYRIDLKRHQYAQASLKLQKIIELYPNDIWGDDAVFHLAELNETFLKNPGRAKELYEQIILKYPGSFYVPEARKHFRNLRGDQPSS